MTIPLASDDNDGDSDDADDGDLTVTFALRTGMRWCCCISRSVAETAYTVPVAYDDDDDDGGGGDGSGGDDYGDDDNDDDDDDYESSSFSCRTLLHNQINSGDICGRFFQLLSAVVESGSRWSVSKPHVLSRCLVKGTSLP